MGRTAVQLLVDPDGMFRAPTAVELEEVKNARKTPPAGYPTDRSQYADPDNLKWPIDEKHIHAAVSYFNQAGEREKGGYSSAQWAEIGRRIARAANKLIGHGHAYVASDAKIATPSNKDPDHDGDDDTSKKGDTDHDASEEIEVSPAYPSLDAFQTPETTIVAEEVVINGVPCFRYEAMLIPGDAVSRNTVPGKRGPTYYAARRVRQYVDDNNRLIEELDGRGQRVTVYPRHAAALAETTLPLGWVENYATRPSTDRHGLEDAWYSACIPLTTEGRDVLARMRTGLVKFSSLRSLDQADAFQTTPVKVNGKVVEEATKLLIGGVDLVATQPGLPVKPIRLLEEAARVEPYEVTPPAQEESHMGKRPVPAQFHTCPSCAADITDHIGAAYEEMALESATAFDKNDNAHPPMTTKGHTHGKFDGHPHSDDNDHSDAPMAKGDAKGGADEEVAQLKQALATEEARRVAIEAELAEAKKAAPVAVAATEEMTALQAKVAALESEIKALDSVKAMQVKLEADAARKAAIEAVIGEDPTQGPMMRAIIEAAVTEETDPKDVALTYWKLRAENTDKLSALRHRAPTGRGFVHLTNALGQTPRASGASGASEESRNGSGNGDNASLNGHAPAEEDSQRRAQDENMSVTKAGVLRMFGSL